MCKHSEVYRKRGPEAYEVQVHNVDYWKSKYDVLVVDFLTIYEVCMNCGYEEAVDVPFWV